MILPEKYFKSILVNLNWMLYILYTQYEFIQSLKPPIQFLCKRLNTVAQIQQPNIRPNNKTILLAG